MGGFQDKRERMERALYTWIDTAKKIEDDVINLIDHNNIARSQIAKDIDKMELKLATLKNNLKTW